VFKEPADIQRPKGATVVCGARGLGIALRARDDVGEFGLTEQNSSLTASAKHV
jgi:hypothetical protein